MHPLQASVENASPCKPVLRMHSPARQCQECISLQASSEKAVALQMSPLIDRTILKTVKQAFGGRVRFVVSGGAPLGPSVEEFLNITLCCPVLQVRPSSALFSSLTS